MTLNDLKPGEEGVVTGITSQGAVRRRLFDMGITPGAHIILKKTAPLGDPLEITVRGYQLSIRKDEAKEIIIEKNELLQPKVRGAGLVSAQTARLNLF